MRRELPAGTRERGSPDRCCPTVVRAADHPHPWFAGPQAPFSNGIDQELAFDGGKLNPWTRRRSIVRRGPALRMMDDRRRDRPRRRRPHAQALASVTAAAPALQIGKEFFGIEGDSANRFGGTESLHGISSDKGHRASAAKKGRRRGPEALPKSDRQRGPRPGLEISLRLMLKMMISAIPGLHADASLGIVLSRKASPRRYRDGDQSQAVPRSSFDRMPSRVMGQMRRKEIQPSEVAAPRRQRPAVVGLARELHLLSPASFLIGCDIVGKDLRTH
jgi:hypothetical protein